MISILHVIADLAPESGGPAKACVEMAQAVAKLGHHVEIYTTNYSPSVAQSQVGLTTVGNVNISTFPCQTPKFWKFSVPLGIALNQKIKNFDIVHLHSLYLFHNAATGLICRRDKVPFIIRPHSILDPYIYKRHRLRKAFLELLYESRNLNTANAIHCTSPEEMRLAAPVVGTKRSFVVPLGINIGDYELSNSESNFWAETLPQTLNKKVLLFLGRINFKKGLDFLIEVFSEIRKGREDVHLVVAGPDTDGYGQGVRKWIEERKLEQDVTILGMVQGKEKVSLLKFADLFLLPSHAENFGISVVEAMVCKTPVIISKHVNLSDWLLPAQAGGVLPLETRQWVDLINEILDNKAFSDGFISKGRALVESTFLWSTVGPQLVEQYQRIIAESSLKRQIP